MLGQRWMCYIGIEPVIEPVFTVVLCGEAMKLTLSVRGPTLDVGIWRLWTSDSDV